jgi:hypothetical protein
MGGWFKKEINTIEDLKGLKMRIPGFAGEIMAAVGAKPTNIPAGELYMVLISFLNQPPIWLPVLPPMMDLMPCLA